MLIERFAASPRDFAFQPHPFFGPLSEREWLHWAWRHTDHHLRQFGRCACRRAYGGRKVATGFVPAHQMSGLRIRGPFRVAFPA
ncbi:MAG: DUF1569 domain-containing protein [Vicinamibacterales bacterium]